MNLSNGIKVNYYDIDGEYEHEIIAVSMAQERRREKERFPRPYVDVSPTFEKKFASRVYITNEAFVLRFPRTYRALTDDELSNGMNLDKLILIVIKILCGIPRETWDKVAVFRWRLFSKAYDYLLERKTPMKRDMSTTVTFVNVSLNQHHRDQVDLLTNESGSIYQYLETMTRDGYNLSIKFRLEDNAYAVTCFGAGLNAGLALTGRSDRLVRALASVIVKHNLVLSQVWGEERPTTDFVE